MGDVITVDFTFDKEQEVLKSTVEAAVATWTASPVMRRHVDELCPHCWGPTACVYLFHYRDAKEDLLRVFCRSSTCQESYSVLAEGREAEDVLKEWHAVTHGGRDGEY